MSLRWFSMVFVTSALMCAVDGQRFAFMQQKVIFNLFSIIDGWNREKKNRQGETKTTRTVGPTPLNQGHFVEVGECQTSLTF